MKDEIRAALEAAGVVLLEPLGSGAFAEVWRVTHRRVPRALRVCLHPLDDSPRGELVQKEQEMLRRLVVIPQILNRIGYIEELPLRVESDGVRNYFATVWQVAESNLLAWWRRAAEPKPEQQLLRYLQQVAATIDVMNDHGFHHRDVKPENILVEGDSAWLCDVGLSAQAGLSRYVGTFVGTETYWTPEMQARGESHPTNDLYCLAASYLSLKTNLKPAEFLESLAAQRRLEALSAAAEEALAAALHPEADLRPRGGAAAWVRRLDSSHSQAAAALAPENNHSAPKNGELRLPLLRRLEAISPMSLLDSVIFRMNMPQQLRPSPLLPHGARCVTLVDWVEQQDRLAELQATLDGLGGCANGPL